MLTIEDLYKSYHYRPILNGTTFTVHEGETIGIVGENGAGKTTLLRILAKITSPDRGDVTINNESLIKGEHTSGAKILYLGHNPNMYPVLSAHENLTFVTKLYGKNDKLNLEDIFDQVGLTNRRFDPIRYFSRGMLQRLALAKAMIVPWNLLLMDEPTTGLDDSGLNLLEEFLRGRPQEKNIVIVVSHRIDWLKQFCSRILTLSRGIIVQPDDR